MTSLLQNGKNRFQVRLRHREGRALDGRDSFSGFHKAIIRDRRDYHAAGKVDLLKQVVVDQSAAVRCCHQIRPSTGSQPDFDRSAAHGFRDGHDRIVLPYFAFFELGHPDLLHSFCLQQPDVLVT